MKGYMNDWIKSVKGIFEDHRHPEQAEGMERYMRDKFKFYGIKSKERRKLTRTFLNDTKNFKQKELTNICLALWELPEREYQHFVVDILKRRVNNLDEKGINLLEKLITNKSWWDTVDMLATNISGKYFKKYPVQIKPVTQNWIESDNIWLNRSAILFQLKYKEETDVDLLLKYIKIKLDSDEFFIQKAIGWVLREYAKTDPELIYNFVQNNDLASLSRREALKNIK